MVSIKDDSSLLLLGSYLYYFFILQIPLVHFHVVWQFRSCFWINLLGDTLVIVIQAHGALPAALWADLIFLMSAVVYYPLFCIKYLCFLSCLSVSKCICRGFNHFCVFSMLLFHQQCLFHFFILLLQLWNKRPHPGKNLYGCKSFLTTECHWNSMAVFLEWEYNHVRNRRQCFRGCTGFVST